MPESFPAHSIAIITNSFILAASSSFFELFENIPFWTDSCGTTLQDSKSHAILFYEQLKKGSIYISHHPRDAKGKYFVTRSLNRHGNTVA
jgi:hypothetical protein